MKCECYGYLHKDNPRYKLWQEIMGEDDPKVPLKYPLPYNHPKFGRIYKGDPQRMTPAQLGNLIEKMAEKFHLSKTEVSADLLKNGDFAVKCDGIIICQKHTAMMM